MRSPYRRSNWYDAIRLDPSKDNVLSQHNDELRNELKAKLVTGVGSLPRRERHMINSSLVCRERTIRLNRPLMIK